MKELSLSYAMHPVPVSPTRVRSRRLTWITFLSRHYHIVARFGRISAKLLPFSQFKAKLQALQRTIGCGMPVNTAPKVRFDRPRSSMEILAKNRRLLKLYMTLQN